MANNPAKFKPQKGSIIFSANLSQSNNLSI